MPDSRVEELLHPRAIRRQAERVFALAEAGELPSFRLHLEALPQVADAVAETTRAQYPAGAVPTHGRFRHFDVGGVPRLAAVRAALPGEPRERARALVDLVVISVLLDAGAGDGWTYTEAATGLRLTRSEGLAVASLRMAEAGAFGGPLRVSAATLEAFDDATLAAGFQITRENPLAGAEGRVALLRSLGRALAARPDLFGPDGRPGSLIDTLAPGDAGRITGPRLLHALLDGFGSIWPGRLTLGGVALGDVWHHPLLGPADSTDGLVPFHKLSQWLAYSLVEPLAEGGVEVTALHELTGLPEYRNGGLFVDGGVLEARDPESHGRVHAMSSELVVSWRALTVALLDRIHPLVAERLGHTVQSFPMGCLLEGGTWLAGRRMAQRRRPGGGSPFLLATDGTVF